MPRIQLSTGVNGDNEMDEALSVDAPPPPTPTASPDKPAKKTATSSPSKNLVRERDVESVIKKTYQSAIESLEQEKKQASNVRATTRKLRNFQEPARLLTGTIERQKMALQAQKEERQLGSKQMKNLIPTLQAGPTGSFNIKVYLLQGTGSNNARNTTPWFLRTSLQFVPVPESDSHNKKQHGSGILSASNLPIYGGKTKAINVVQDFFMTHGRFLHAIERYEQVYLVNATIDDRKRRKRESSSSASSAMQSFLIWWIPSQSGTSRGYHGKWSSALAWPPPNPSDFLTATTHLRKAFQVHGQPDDLPIPDVVILPRGEFNGPQPLEYKVPDGWDANLLEANKHVFTMLYKSPSFKHWISPEAFDWRSATKIGSGAFGAVYRVIMIQESKTKKGKHRNSSRGNGRDVVVKLSYAENAHLSLFGPNEAAIGLDMEHTNIIHTIGWFSIGRFHGIVLEGMSYDLQAALSATANISTITRVHQQSSLQLEASLNLSSILSPSELSLVRSNVAAQIHLIVDEVKRFFNLPQHFRALSTVQILDILHGVASGMHYMHSKNVIHRDIKPSNILLDESGVPRIGDLGLSIPASSVASIIGGTHSYMPSLMVRRQKQGNPFTFSHGGGDWYSLGILITRDILSTHPNIDDSVTVVANRLLSMWQENTSSEEMMDIISRAVEIAAVAEGADANTSAAVNNFIASSPITPKKTGIGRARKGGAMLPPRTPAAAVRKTAKRRNAAVVPKLAPRSPKPQVQRRSPRLAAKVR